MQILDTVDGAQTPTDTVKSSQVTTKEGWFSPLLLPFDLNTFKKFPLLD